MTGKSSNNRNIELAVIMIDNKLIGVFDEDIRKNVNEFLNNFDSDYFSNMGQFLTEKFENSSIDQKEKNEFSITLRIIHSVALETFFSLMFAGIQAPHAIPFWINRYTSSDLRSLIKKITENDEGKENEINCLYGNQNFTWDSMIEKIFSYIIISDKETKESIIEIFKYFTKHFAHYYSKDNFTNEYNSIKHGFRVIPGGFKLQMRTEDGTDHELAESLYGSRFLNLEQSTDQKHLFFINKDLLNWSPIQYIYDLSVLSGLIWNLIFIYRILNEIEIKPSESLKILEFKKYKEQYLSIINESSLNIKHPLVGFSDYSYFSKENLKKFYRDNKQILSIPTIDKTEY